MTIEQLIREVEAQRALMIDVSTGGTRIQQVEDKYKSRREAIQKALGELGIEDPNPFSDLWRWYQRWTSGDLPTYRSRRNFVADLYDPLIEAVVRRERGISSVVEPTGWVKVDRVIEKMRTRLEQAKNEEDFQSVGHLCREVLISVAESAFDHHTHGSYCDVKPSETDAKRMLDAYFAHELKGGSNEAARKHAKAAVDLANALQHRRTAVFRDAAMCAEATTAVVNVVAIVSGKRDPD